MPFGLPWSEQFVSQLADKEIRDEFVADQVRTRIALMIRALREQRDLSQADLGKLANKPQSVISRIEDPDYGSHSIQTLLEVAAAFDLPLFVDIPEWEDWFRHVGNLTGAIAGRRAFSSERLAKTARHAEESAASGATAVLKPVSSQGKSRQFRSTAGNSKVRRSAAASETRTLKVANG